MDFSKYAAKQNTSKSTTDFSQYSAKQAVNPLDSFGAISNTTDTKKANTTSVAPIFSASEGTGIGAITGNVAKAIGNIPSSAANLIGTTIAQPAKTTGEALSGVQQVFQEQGAKEGGKNLLMGYANTIDKIASTIYGGAKNAAIALAKDPVKAFQDVAAHIAKVGIEDPLLIPSLIYGGPKAAGAKADVVSTVAAPLVNETKAVGSDVFNLLTQKTEQGINKEVVSAFNKAVKPSIAGKSTIAKAQQYDNKVVEGVKAITENKPSLSFTDEAGNVIKGETPKTLKQTTEAIEQTKKGIFQQYDALAKQAGGEGLTVDTAPITNELDTIINDKSLALANPKAIDYAQSVKDRYAQVGKIDAATTQDVIKHYNSSLDAFYKNPSYDNASQAAIDAMIANRLRVSLDEGVSKITGADYQALKNKYGALKTIENDVVKASLRDAKKNTKGLIDFTDLLSGGQTVNGILSLNPGLIAQGVTTKALTSFYKYLNSPSRFIEKMFTAAEQSGKAIPVKSNLGKVIKNIRK